MLRIQKLLILGTRGQSLREEVISMSAEDGNLIKLNSEIGRSDSLSLRMGIPETVMHAIGFGWRLMSPPVKETDGTYTWWLDNQNMEEK